MSLVNFPCSLSNVGPIVINDIFMFCIGYSVFNENSGGVLGRRFKMICSENIIYVFLAISIIQKFQIVEGK